MLNRDEDILKAAENWQKAGHGVARAVCVFDALAKHHVAAALAMHRPCACKPRETRTETLHSRERSGVKLGIAAGKPTAVTTFRRRLIGERRERDDFCAGTAPAGQHVFIHEAESAVARQRNALAGR